jgi:Tol biopolymer transport system component
MALAARTAGAYPQVGGKEGNMRATRSLVSPSLIIAACLAAVSAWGGVTERVSVSNAGAEGNATSWGPSISADGRFVAFDSDASNLVPGDTNGATDVFVRDRLTGGTERVSVSSNGEQGNGPSGGRSISPDGGFVAFHSSAANLVPGDTNGQTDVFLRDRVAGTTERVSISTLGEQANGACVSPSVSAGGGFIVFTSEATNLASGDTNGQPDVFVRDRLAARTERVSVSNAGEQGNGPSGSGPISADGRFVVFDSRASNLVPSDVGGWMDVFVRDRASGTTERVSVTNTGEEGNQDSFGPAISPDARFVAFISQATNFVPGDGNWQSDIYVRDRQWGLTERASLTTTGEDPNNYSGSPSISADGRYVAFDSLASNLAPGDANGTTDVFVRDRETGMTEIVSISTADEIGNGSSNWPSISQDGRLVAFSSEASNLVSDDTNGARDTFVRDRWPEAVPPETAIVYGPCGLVISSSDATICWTGSDNETLPQGLRYSWRLDSGGWSAFSRATCSNLTGLSEGAHVLEVKAMDVCENVDPTPAQCQFTVDLSGPSVSITSPAYQATVRGLVDISAAASHSSGIQRVEFYAAGQLISTDSSEPYSCSWDTKPVSVAEGPTQICAKAYANDGKVAWSCILVTVDNTTFDDVPKSAWFWAHVEALVRAEITSGCAQAMYCPYQSVTRAQMAKFLCIAAGKQPLDSATPTFADVPKTNWAYGYIERLADADSWGGTPPTSGIACPPGVPPGSRCYGPFQPVTREQMAKFLCLAASNPAMPSCSGTFADVASAGWACPWIERLADPGSWGGTPVTSGCACPPGYPGGAKCYCPKDNCTRAQMAKFLVLAFGIPL